MASAASSGRASPPSSPPLMPCRSSRPSATRRTGRTSRRAPVPAPSGRCPSPEAATSSCPRASSAATRRGACGAPSSSTATTPAVASESSGPAPTEFRVTAVTTRDAWTRDGRGGAGRDRAPECCARSCSPARSTSSPTSRSTFPVSSRSCAGRNPVVSCTPTAGSLEPARSSSCASRARRSTARPLAGTGVDTSALVRSAKDGHEHRLVVDAVVDALGRLCSDGPRRRSAAARARRRQPPRHNRHRSCRIGGDVGHRPGGGFAPHPGRRGYAPPPRARRDRRARAGGAGPLRGPVRLGRRPGRRRVRRGVARRRSRRDAGADPRGCRHRFGLRSRRRVGRDAAEAHADAASLGSTVTRTGVAASDRSPARTSRGRNTITITQQANATSGSTSCRKRCPSAPT